MLEMHNVKNGKQSFVGGSILHATEQEIKMADPEYITFYDHLPDYPARITGQYRHGTATGELTRVDQGKGRLNRFLRLKFVSLKDGQELYTLIRSGQILPQVSYEEKQIDTPIQQARDLVRLLWRQLVTSAAIQFRSWAADIRSRMAA